MDIYWLEYFDTGLEREFSYEISARSLDEAANYFCLRIYEDSDGVRDYTPKEVMEHIVCETSRKEAYNDPEDDYTRSNV